MTKQASGEPKAGLTDRITRAQSSKASRTLEGPSERRRTRASSSLEQQGAKVASTRTLSSSAAEQPAPIPPPRKRWFLDCVEIPPYPRTARRLPHRPTLEKPPQPERSEKRRSARSAQGASSLPLKRLRRSKRGRAERSPSVEEAEEAAASKVGGQFDWWYESSLSPLTDIGSRPPSPVNVVVEGVSEVGVVLEGNEEELGVSRGSAALAPQATVDGMAAGEENLQVNEPTDEPTQHPMGAPKNGEISSPPSVPAEEGYISDDGCPTEAQRGSPICEGLDGEPASSPALTSINSPEVIAEPLAPPRLEATPVNEGASAKPTIEKPSPGLATSNTNISLEGVAAHEACQPISALPNMVTHPVHPTPPPPPAAGQLYIQIPVNPNLGDNGVYSAVPEVLMPAGCEFGGYSTPDPSSGWTTPYPLHPCDTMTSDHTRVENLMSISPNQQHPFNMQPSVPPPLAVPFAPNTATAQFFGQPDPSISHYNSQPTFFGTREFGRTQPSITTSQRTPEYLSSITPHFTPPPSTIAFAPVIPHDWLPNQPPPHPAALPEIAARVMLQQEEPATRPPSPPHNPQPTVKKGKGKYARKTMKTEHYEFSSFSYYPLGQPPPSSTPESTASSSTTAVTEPILHPESLIRPSNPPPTSSTYVQDPQGHSMSMEATNVSAPDFSSFVNLTPASFVQPGEGAQPLISSSKYRPTGVRWM